MIKIFYLLLVLFIFSECSMHSNSKFWTSTKNINEEKTPNYKEILVEEKAFKKELNSNIKIKFNSKPLTKFFSQ